MGRIFLRQELIKLRKAEMGKVYQKYRDINDKLNMLERDYKAIELTDEQERQLVRSIRNDAKDMRKMLKSFIKEYNIVLKRVGEDELGENDE